MHPRTGLNPAIGAIYQCVCYYYYYAIFIDLTKAVDTINRKSLCTILRCYECPIKYVKTIKLFHDGMAGQGLSNGNSLASIGNMNWVKQYCVLTPVFQLVLHLHVFAQCSRSRRRSDIRYWHNGYLFNVCHLKANKDLPSPHQGSSL